MPIDPQRIGTMAMEVMGALEQKYGEDAEIDVFGLLTAVDHGDQVTIEFSFRRGDGRAVPVHVARGLLAEVDRGIARN